MTDIDGLANFATIAIAINLAYINLDNYRHFKKMKVFLYGKLRDKKPFEILRIFNLVNAAENSDVIAEDNATKIKICYSFLELFGRISEFRIRLPQNEMIVVMPASKNFEKAIDDTDLNYMNDIDRIVKSNTPKPNKTNSSDSEYPVSDKQIYSFFKMFFFEPAYSLRTKDQIYSIFALFFSLGVLFLISLNEVIPDELKTNHPYFMPIAIVIISIIVMSYVVNWIWIQKKIRQFKNTQTEEFPNFQYNIILAAPLVFLIPGFFYSLPGENTWLVSFQGFTNQFLPPMFLFIICVSAFVPFALLLNGYRMVPLVQKQIVDSIELLLKEADIAIKTSKIKDTLNFEENWQKVLEDSIVKRLQDELKISVEPKHSIAAIKTNKKRKPAGKS